MKIERIKLPTGEKQNVLVIKNLRCDHSLVLISIAESNRYRMEPVLVQERDEQTVR